MGTSAVSYTSVIFLFLPVGLIDGSVPVLMAALQKYQENKLGR